MKFRLFGITLDAEVKDQQATVHQVIPGSNYGHLVKTTKYMHLIPTDLVVTSTLDDTNQLQFKSGSAWTCTMHFQPKDAGANALELLQCGKPRVRSQDKITVSVVDKSSTKQVTPQSEWLAIA